MTRLTDKNGPRTRWGLRFSDFRGRESDFRTPTKQKPREPIKTKTIPRTPHITEIELRKLCHMVSILEPRDTSTFPVDTVAELQGVGPLDGEDWMTDADEDGIDEDGADEEVGSDDDLSFEDDDGFRRWLLYRLT